MATFVAMGFSCRLAYVFVDTQASDTTPGGKSMICKGHMVVHATHVRKNKICECYKGVHATELPVKESKRDQNN